MADKRADYRPWEFADNVQLIPREVQWKAYFDKKFGDIDVDIDMDEFKGIVEEVVETNIEPVNINIEEAKTEINNNITDSKEEIITHIDEVKEDVKEGVINEINASEENIVNKIEDAKEHLCCDICCSKNEIINHIDSKIDAVNFEEEFSNLNEQVAEILRKLDE